MGEWRIVTWQALRECALRHAIPMRLAETAVLEAGIVPSRYERNLGVWGVEGQAALARSCVLVAGCGGLGGFAAEMLARAGVGSIVLVDGDSFTESNLNRQMGCTEASLGRNKAEVTAERIQTVNSAVEVTVHPVMFDKSTLPAMAEGCSVLVDALDSIESRVTLCEIAAQMKLPLVHGGIENMCGQVACVQPGDVSLLHLLFLAAKEPSCHRFANPVASVAVASAIQVSQVLQLLTGGKKALEGRMLSFDLEAMGFDTWLLPS